MAAKPKRNLKDETPTAEDRSNQVAHLTPEQQALLMLKLRKNQARQQAAQTETSIPIVEKREHLPLSFVQERMWFIHQLAPDSPSYSGLEAVQITGRLDIDVLQKSVNEVVKRHEILRTTFMAVDGRPVQVISPHLSLPLPVFDFQGWPENKQEQELKQLYQKKELLPFDLEQGPLLELTLVQFSATKFFLLSRMHHIISDGWSVNILVGEIAKIYTGLAQNAIIFLPDLPIQYADFSVWQRAHLQGDALASLLQYWKQQLKDIPQTLPLPTDRPRPAVPTFRGERQTLRLPLALAQRLKEITQQENATLFMTLMAAFKVLLYRYTSIDDIVVGSPIANRNRAEIEPLIGFFANTLLLRTSLDGDPSFRTLLARVRQVCLEAYSHQDLPFQKLLEEMQIKRSLDNPLFQVMFSFKSTPISPITFADITLIPLEIERTTAKFDLSLEMEDTGAGLIGRFNYYADLFDYATMAQMVAHFRRLLEEIAANPERKIADFLLVIPEVVQTSLEPQMTELDVPPHCLHQLFEIQATQTPEAVALCCGTQRLTYRQLNERANQLAHHLREIGIHPDEVVGICLPRSIEMVIAQLAVLKAGGAYLPLDPAYPTQRLSFMVIDACVTALLTQASFAEWFTEHDVTVLCLSPNWDEWQQYPPNNLESLVSKANLAYVIYTSGSTGKPKGVMVHHGGLTNYLYWALQSYPVDPDCVVPVHSSVGFDLTITSLFVTLLAGLEVWLLPEDDVFNLAQAFTNAHKRIGLVKLTPTHFSLLSRQLDPQELADCTATFVVGGEQLTAETVSYWQQQFPHTIVFNEYGPTEAVVGCCVHQIRPAKIDRGNIPIGVPIANTQIYILDEALRLLPEGIPGELYVGGAGVTRGYFNQPRLTAERFIPDPFSTDGSGQRLYRTGDRARVLPDGTIEFLGRLDRQVKIRGYRIEMGEVEASLQQHLAIQEVLVVDQNLPTGQKRLVAYFISNQEKPLTVEQLRNFLQNKLPEYMIPATFVPLAAFPLTINGKIDHHSLPAPKQARSLLEETYIPPRTAIEKQLAGIWSEVLGIPSIGIHDNFFALGGDSILSIRIVSKTNQAGLPLTPRQIFQAQTIAELAAVVGTRTPIQADQTAITGSVPLLPIQQWFFENHATNPHHFNQSVMLKIHPGVDITSLKQAVRYLLIYHDALRLLYTKEERQWRQSHSAPLAHLPFQYVDLSHLPKRISIKALGETSAVMQATLNIETGPLLRLVYFDLGHQTPGRFLIVIHHLVVDTVSWQILLADLQQLYEQLCQNRTLLLPAKTTSFKYWSERLHQYAHSNTLMQELPFWLDKRRIQVRQLPRDFSTGVEMPLQQTADTLVVSLSREETEALLRDVPQVYNTQINDLLLAALAWGLQKWTRDDLILVDLEGHGREDLFDEVDLSRTVGWFTTQFPVLLDLAGLSQPGEILIAIKEKLRQIPNHGLGYGLLRISNDTATKALLDYPQAEIAFNYLGQFDTASGNEALFEKAEEFMGPQIGSKLKLAHLLAINGRIAQGQLTLDWTYSQDVYAYETIATLTQLYISSLQDLIAHCLEQAVGQYTPSDFPLANLTPAQLKHIMTLVEQTTGKSGQEVVEDVYPLAPIQQGILFHVLFEPEMAAYFEQFMVTLTGDIDISAFERAWQIVVNHHPILRTAFIWQGMETPMQVVWRQVEVSLNHLDWRHLSPAEQNAHYEAFLLADRQRGLNYSKPPLLRLSLIQKAAQVYELIWSYNHIIIDGWSTPIFFNEINTAYHHLRYGKEPQLEGRRPYRDYVAWLQQQDMAQTEAFWRCVLGGFSSPTPIAASVNWGAEPDNSPGLENYGFCKRRLSQKATTALKHLAQQHQVSLYTIVQGAWALLLSWYTCEKDVVFGITVSGRSPELTGIEKMVGIFINTIPTRVFIPKEKSLIPWLKQLQDERLETLEYESSSLAQVQTWSDIPPGEQLFESILVFENYPVYSAAAYEENTALNIEATDFLSRTNYPLTVLAAPTTEFLIAMSYDTRRFGHQVVQRMAEHFQNILENIVSNPEQNITEITPVDRTEQQYLLQTLNNTAEAYPERQCFTQLFEAQVEQAPQATAVVYREQEITYRQLNVRANRLAHTLIEQGVKVGDVVALLAERDIEFLVAILAIFKAGGAYMPLDPRHPAQRHKLILEQSQAPFLITTADLVSPAMEAVASLPVTNQPTILQFHHLRQHKQLEDNPSPQTTFLDLAYVLFTSGSTGIPKGAMVDHRGMLNHMYAMMSELQLSAQDRVVQNATQSFDISVWQFLVALLLGGQVHIFPDEVAHDPRKLLQQTEQQQITLLEIVPSLLRVMLDHSDEQPDFKPSLPALRWLLVTGEALPPELCQQWFHHYPQIPLVNAYGPTECADDVTLHLIHSVPSSNLIRMPIGKAIVNTQLYILDDQLRVVPFGIAGELYIGGDGVGWGYLNNPRRTAEAFLPNPFSAKTGERLYKTGDRVRYLSDGSIEFIGRVDYQVKVRGFRIEMGEIEHTLRQHPAVREAVVMDKEDVTGGKQLVAYLVPHTSLPAIADLNSFLEERLPYYMIPSTFMPLAAMPLTPNGKIDRRALPTPDRRPLEEREFVAPGSPTEEKVAQIWAEVLKRERIGIYDNFFELGGHSLLVTKVISRLLLAFAVELPLRALFDSPTVAELSLLVEEKVLEQLADEQLEEIWAEIEDISDEEAEQLLTQEETSI